MTTRLSRKELKVAKVWVSYGIGSAWQAMVLSPGLFEGGSYKWRGKYLTKSSRNGLTSPTRKNPVALYNQSQRTRYKY
jgi:hypothetical protein